MYTKTTLEISQDGVRVVTQKFIMDGGFEYEVGQPHSAAFPNSVFGRRDAEAYLSTEDWSAVLAKWGSAPTVEELIE